MKNNYAILGVSEFATNEEIELKYNELIEKYRKDRFLEGEAGNYAAKRLTEVQVAYSEIMEYRHQNDFDNDGLYGEVEKAIKAGDIRLAQEKLDQFNERTAKWHYLQSVVFHRKNWNNECKKQLEIAISMDGENEKYKQAYEKLKAQMEKPKDNYYESGSQSRQYSDPEPQMGGGSCLDFCCQMLACNMLLNCCCNCN